EDLRTRPSHSDETDAETRAGAAFAQEVHDERFQLAAHVSIVINETIPSTHTTRSTRRTSASAYPVSQNTTYDPALSTTRPTTKPIYAAIRSEPPRPDRTGASCRTNERRSLSVHGDLSEHALGSVELTYDALDVNPYAGGLSRARARHSPPSPPPDSITTRPDSRSYDVSYELPYRRHAVRPSSLLLDGQRPDRNRTNLLYSSCALSAEPPCPDRNRHELSNKRAPNVSPFHALRRPDRNRSSDMPSELAIPEHAGFVTTSRTRTSSTPRNTARERKGPFRPDRNRHRRWRPDMHANDRQVDDERFKTHASARDSEDIEEIYQNLRIR
ncbi:hypothetical protein EXIGLDRAFT_772430, partial [Exidia glandulosa HHB12029]